MLEQAREAMEQSLSNSATTEQSQENSQGTQSQSEVQVQSNQPDVLELDKLERFKYDGREWTPAELKSSIMRQDDYTRKTQEFAADRKYYDNLAADLKFVRENPAHAEDFRKLYPEKFHSYLEFAGSNQAAAQAQPTQQVQAQPSQAQLPQEFLSEFNELRSAWKQQETEKELARIENVMGALAKKYEYADEQSVLATAQAAHAQAVQQFGKGTKLTDQQWEQIYQRDHERQLARYEGFYKTKISQQTEANKKARDAGAGGGTPGQAPVKRSFREAAEAALAHAEGRS